MSAAPARGRSAAGVAKGCLAMGCVGALAACLTLVVALALLGTWLESDEGGTPISDDYRRGPDVREFDSADDGAGYRLSFGFADHHGRVHRVSCRVSHSDLEAELAAFGFAEDELWPRFNRRLRERLEQEVRRRRLEPYFQIETWEHGSYRWRWRVEGSVPEPERTRAVAASRELGAWIESEFPGQHRRIKAALVAEHGFELSENGGLRIDYARLAETGTRTLADCQQALLAAGAGSGWRQYLGLYLAFFQTLTYEVPPVSEQGRYQLGLWVPTQVLAQGKGDCDSKSVALTSMLRRFGRRILFILLPRHALIGVEMTPGPGERYVRLGNRYFVLCDAAGPARIPPGGQAISGDYRYILIEPEFSG